MSKPRNVQMKMLEKIDVIELSNNFTLEMIAHTFNCSAQFVRNCITRQELLTKTNKQELEMCNKSKGAWRELKETELYQRLMLNG